MGREVDAHRQRARRGHDPQLPLQEEVLDDGLVLHAQVRVVVADTLADALFQAIVADLPGRVEQQGPVLGIADEHALAVVVAVLRAELLCQPGSLRLCVAEAQRRLAARVLDEHRVHVVIELLREHELVVAVELIRLDVDLKRHRPHLVPEGERGPGRRSQPLRHLRSEHIASERVSDRAGEHEPHQSRTSSTFRNVAEQAMNRGATASPLPSLSLDTMASSDGPRFSASKCTSSSMTKHTCERKPVPASLQLPARRVMLSKRSGVVRTMSLCSSSSTPFDQCSPVNSLTVRPSVLPNRAFHSCRRRAGRAWWAW